MPSENPQRRNHGPAQVIDGEAFEPPPLPAAGTYTQATRDWYETWCKSEQASLFITTDWQRLHMLAPVVEALFTTDDASLKLRLMAEIRQNEAKLGATPEDRQRLRWKIAPPEPPTASEPVAKKSRSRKDPRGTT